MEENKMKMFIGGEWVESVSGGRFSSFSPATGEEIATVPKGTRDDVRKALTGALEVQGDLSRLTAFQRAALCHRIADELNKHSEELSEWLAMDQGKPIEGEAPMEVDQTVRHYREAAEDVKRMETPVLPSSDKDKRILVMRQPRGTVGVITPWNFPLAIPSEYISAALATGNCVVWNPASSTSAIAVKLAQCIEKALIEEGIHRSVFSMVTGEGSVVGNELVINSGTDAIGLTGSPEVGERVARKAGLKHLLLELGGNGPVIVLEDADVKKAAQAAAFGSFYCAGQVCVASERILVHEAVHDEFVDYLVEEAKRINLGPSLDEDTTMGPLNNAEVAHKMDRHVRDARDKGAEVVFGGERDGEFPTDLYYKPTVLTGVTPEMEVNKQETFGPIAPVIKFKTDDQALEITNSIELGLLSAVFTTSLNRAYYFAENIQTGAVNINENSDYWEIHTPIGGFSGKKSGLGRLGGRWALEEMTQIKTVTFDVGDSE